MKGKYNIAGSYKEFKQSLKENLFAKKGEENEEEVAEEIADEVETEMEEEEAEEEDAIVAGRAQEDAEVEADGEAHHAMRGGGYGTPGINAPDTTPMPAMFGGGTGQLPDMGGAIPAIQHAISVAFSIGGEGEGDGMSPLTSFERPEWVVTRVMTDRGERVAMEKQHETDAEILVGNLSYEAALQASTDMSQKLEIPEYDNATDKYIGKVSSKVVRKEKPLGGSYKYN